MKVLVWNIKFFSSSRIVGQTATGYAEAENLSRTKNDAARALATLSYIVSTVRRTAADVFVVVEPRASAGEPGTLADSSSGGPAGLILLLAHLRSMLGNTWYLVPPQRINSTQIDIIDGGSRYTECIGVFWNSKNVTFTGPWINTATGPAAAGTPAAYTGAYANVVPADSTWAGTTSFADITGFPDPTSRRPFLTTFTEVAAPQRTLELYSVHCDTANGARAADAIRRIAFVDAAKKIILIAGDFNVDVSAPTGSGYLSMNSTFSKGFAKLYPGPIQTFYNRFPQFGPTMLRRGPDATPGNYSKNETLDFALIHLGAEAGNIDNCLCEAIDRVAQTPNRIGRAMSYALSDFTRGDNPIPVDRFRDRFNFGKIGTPAGIPSAPAVLADGTSDHLPILLTV